MNAVEIDMIQSIKFPKARSLRGAREAERRLVKCNDAAISLNRAPRHVKEITAFPISQDDDELKRQCIGARINNQKKMIK